jgi:hypothetical protein
MVRLELSVDLVFNAPQMVSFFEFADFWRVISTLDYQNSLLVWLGWRE